MTEFYIVQHGDKAPEAGDPPLTALGIAQAERTGRYLRERRITLLVSSPSRRTRETALHLARALNLPIETDDRLRERMDWSGDPSQTQEDFLREWDRASADREFRPRSGDSSRAAGDRLHTCLEEIAARHPHERVAIVSHGGVTVDLLRNLFSDAYLNTHRPGLIATGPPGCAITHLAVHGDRYELKALASIAHLASPR
jgi:broad specificity phosphatase PhoE